MSVAIEAFAKDFEPKFRKLISDVRNTSGVAAAEMLRQQLRSAAGPADEARDEHGQWTSGGGDLTVADKALIAGDWAWPNSNPGKGHSYEDLRDPSTASGKMMTGVLEKMPEHNGVTFRGISLERDKDVEQLVSAKGFTLREHSSSSLDKDTALMFMDSQSVGTSQPVLMELHGRGRDITSHLPDDLQDTKEVVLLAGTRYKFQKLVHERTPDEAHRRGYPYTRVVFKEQR